MTMAGYIRIKRMSDSLLGWLGFRRQLSSPDGSDGAADGLAVALIPQERGRDLRRRLIEMIGQFLVDHDLEITPHNLAIAHGAVSGLNPRLKRKIASQRAAGEMITQDWLDRATASELVEEDKAVENLIKQLEITISQFKRTTQTAQTTTREYGDALAEHVDKLVAVPESGPDTGDMISELAEYARAMIKRSRRVEAELRQSEEEAASLRHTLDRARRDAEVDFLTGLPNRRAFEAELERNFTEASAAGEPLCIAF